VPRGDSRHRPACLWPQAGCGSAPSPRGKKLEPHCRFGADQEREGRVDIEQPGKAGYACLHVSLTYFRAAAGPRPRSRDDCSAVNLIGAGIDRRRSRTGGNRRAGRPLWRGSPSQKQEASGPIADRRVSCAATSSSDQNILGCSSIRTDDLAALRLRRTGEGRRQKASASIQFA